MHILHFNKKISQYTAAFQCFLHAGSGVGLYVAMGSSKVANRLLITACDIICKRMTEEEAGNWVITAIRTDPSNSLYACMVTGSVAMICKFLIPYHGSLHHNNIMKTFYHRYVMGSLSLHNYML